MRRKRLATLRDGSAAARADQLSRIVSSSDTKSKQICRLATREGQMRQLNAAGNGSAKEVFKIDLQFVFHCSARSWIGSIPKLVWVNLYFAGGPASSIDQPRQPERNHESLRLAADAHGGFERLSGEFRSAKDIGLHR